MRRRASWTSAPMLLAILLTMLLAILLAILQPLSAAATPPPKRPHPHRKPWPITVTVQTVPVLAGVRLKFDDQIAVTNWRGRASFTHEHNFAPHSLQLIDTALTRPGERLRFVRWAGQRDPQQAFRSSVSGLPMRMSYTVTAAFAVQREVVTTLVDEKSRPVPGSRVSAVTLRSATGSAVNVPASGQLWLDAVVPVYRDSAIALQAETYSLTSVIVGGTNVVDAGRQKFRPNQTPDPVFHTKFFDLTVTAHDLLLKSAAGVAARVTFPDGSVHTLPFGPQGRITVPNLPRGTYDITLDGGGTPVPSQLVLSRNTTVDLPVATPRDYGILLLIGTGLAIGLLGIGRGRGALVRAVRRTMRSLRRGRNPEPA